MPFIKSIDFAVKLQFRHLESYIHKDYKNSNHPQVRRFEDTQLKDSEWQKLIKNSKKKFKKIICTPYDEKSVDKIIRYKFDCLKIASCSMNEWPLLEYIAKKIKKKIICSLGGATDCEIRNTISFFSNKKKNINYLYCVAKYPTEAQNLNLSYFSHLRNIYGDKVLGLSTHENPDENISGALGYVMGARIFEKHVGISKRSYKLNKYSANPSQMYNWLENLDRAITLFGSVNDRNRFVPEEKKNLFAFKRGAFLKDKNNVLKNNFLNNKDVTFSFPAVPGQLLANDFSKYNIFKTRSNIYQHAPIIKKNILITNSTEKIQIIREKILHMILKSKITVPKSARLEISHHYGLKNFKKFGMCMITIFNSVYCKKLLFLFKDQKHPEQFHKKKQETFFILQGRVQLKIRYKKKNKSYILIPGNIMTIYPGEIHSFSCLSSSGAIIEELSTNSASQDSYYLDRKILSNKLRKSLISLY